MKVNKLVSIVLFLIFLSNILGLQVNAAIDPFNAKVWVDCEDVASGGSFDVNVYGSVIMSLFSFELHYDSSLLTLTNVKYKSKDISTRTNTDGLLIFYLYSFSAISFDDSVIATLTFEAAEVSDIATTSITINPEVEYLGKGEYQDILYTETGLPYTSWPGYSALFTGIDFNIINYAVAHITNLSLSDYTPSPNEIITLDYDFIPSDNGGEDISEIVWSNALGGLLYGTVEGNKYTVSEDDAINGIILKATISPLGSHDLVFGKSLSVTATDSVKKYLSFSVLEKTARIGKSLLISVCANGGDVTHWGISLTYDSSLLRYDSNSFSSNDSDIIVDSFLDGNILIKRISDVPINYNETIVFTLSFLIDENVLVNTTSSIVISPIVKKINITETETAIYDNFGFPYIDTPWLCADFFNGDLIFKNFVLPENITLNYSGFAFEKEDTYIVTVKLLKNDINPNDASILINNVALFFSPERSLYEFNTFIGLVPIVNQTVEMLSDASAIINSPSVPLYYGKPSNPNYSYSIQPADVARALSMFRNGYIGFSDAQLLSADVTGSSLLHAANVARILAGFKNSNKENFSVINQ